MLYNVTSIYLIDSVIFTVKLTEIASDSYVILNHFCLSIFLLFSFHFSLSPLFFAFRSIVLGFLLQPRNVSSYCFDASRFFFSNIIIIYYFPFIHRDNSCLKMERDLLIPSTRNKRLEIPLAATVE